MNGRRLSLQVEAAGQIKRIMRIIDGKIVVRPDRIVCACY